MALKDLLKKHKADGDPDIKVHQPQEGGLTVPGQQSGQGVPQFTFMRTTTNTQEVIDPPLYPGDAKALQPNAYDTTPPKHKSRFRRSSHAGEPSAGDRSSQERPRSSGDKRASLGERLHLSRNRSASSSSVNVPEDLPEIEAKVGEGEEDWERRAMILAKSNPNQENSTTARPAVTSRSVSTECLVEDDVDIQEAIRLHEAGDLTRSTMMFGKLADPNGENNALSQVLYGLALR